MLTRGLRTGYGTNEGNTLRVLPSNVCRINQIQTYHPPGGVYITADQRRAVLLEVVVILTLMQSQKLVRLLSALLALGLAAPSLFAWGSKGHTIINRLAVESLPADVPAFLKTPDAVAEIVYLGPEPDRWRSRAEPELNAEQAPDHFMDMEFADRIGTLPRQRYQYIAALYAYAAAHPDQAAEMRPERVGFQPYITSEVWERLKSAMRDYRTLTAKHEDTKPVEAAILFYAGWLGHYVADGSQPLHVTIQYNGWVGPNPNGYTTAHTIHSQFETAFVDAAVNAPDVQPLMAPVKTIGSEWDDYLAYLRHTGTYIEKVYQLEKQQGFEGTGTPEAKQFTAERLAAGASMLRDLIYAAWVKSAEPVPESHEQSAAAVASPSTQENILVMSPPRHVPGKCGKPTAQPPFTGTVYFVGGPVSAPVLTCAPKAEFSREAESAKFQGVAVVGLIVDENGTPRNVHIVRPLGMGLDEKAVEAVQKYHFASATYSNKPIAVAIYMEVPFEMY